MPNNTLIKSMSENDSVVSANVIFTKTNEFRATVEVRTRSGRTLLIPEFEITIGGKTWNEFPDCYVKNCIINAVDKYVNKIIRKYRLLKELGEDQLTNTIKEDRQLILNTFPAIKCMVCDKIHPLVSKEYLTFMGNVMVGTEGGLIGNNLSDDNKVNRFSYVCRKPECVNKILLGEE